ncbi:VanZ family protein [Paracoccus hibiscisoli]|uniref:Teicoplanin resistance protein VanZ n=1 Tax=Paracoccus hibiscisoli TaxID=2023261 RepID=A0A4U0QUM6_9RHOB|nr:VanZ family protein [Paracoccus hibiscisoli]TJZ85785.1 teicoplanin resistance protein VanZ [Paracoccus hibiscisoli]
MLLQSKLALGLTFLLAVGIAALTLTPIINVPAPVEQSDKIYHALAFAALAFPISFFRPSWLLVAVPAFAGFGGMIEIIQPYVGRECSFYDWFADLVGIVLGVVCGRAATVALPKAFRP